MEIYYDKKEQIWKEHKEPFATIECPTEEDYEQIKEMVSFWNEFKDDRDRIRELLKGEKGTESEVTPVVHGRWNPVAYDGYADDYPVWDEWECDQCGHEHYGDEDSLSAYCPDCGAKMDSEVNHE